MLPKYKTEVHVQTDPTRTLGFSDSEPGIPKPSVAKARTCFDQLEKEVLPSFYLKLWGEKPQIYPFQNIPAKRRAGSEEGMW